MQIQFWENNSNENKHKIPQINANTCKCLIEKLDPEYKLSNKYL